MKTVFLLLTWQSRFRTPGRQSGHKNNNTAISKPADPNQQLSHDRNHLFKGNQLAHIYWKESFAIYKASYIHPSLRNSHFSLNVLFLWTTFSRNVRNKHRAWMFLQQKQVFSLHEPTCCIKWKRCDLLGHTVTQRMTADRRFCPVATPIYISRARPLNSVVVRHKILICSLDLTMHELYQPWQQPSQPKNR